MDLPFSSRLIQTDGVVGNAIATRVLAHLGALEAPSVPAAELVLHGGAWVWLALLEAPATAAAARKALKPVTAQLGEGKPPPGCAQLARALAAKPAPRSALWLRQLSSQYAPSAAASITCEVPVWPQSSRYVGAPVASSTATAAVASPPSGSPAPAIVS
ncbi:hypothetical protein T492DRAFT_866084 [Pavlovales sp. CCMP2436]|nr:hypothetical protein T492DRAFT_866084 [Pavlovales sp. CCMP2436]